MCGTRRLSQPPTAAVLFVSVPPLSCCQSISVNAAQLKSLEACLTSDEVFWVLQGLPLACCPCHAPGIMLASQTKHPCKHPCKPGSETDSSVHCSQRVLTALQPPYLHPGVCFLQARVPAASPAPEAGGRPPDVWSDGQ